MYVLETEKRKRLTLTFPLIFVRHPFLVSCVDDVGLEACGPSSSPPWATEKRNLPKSTALIVFMVSDAENPGPRRSWHGDGMVRSAYDEPMDLRYIKY